MRQAIGGARTFMQGPLVYSSLTFSGQTTWQRTFGHPHASLQEKLTYRCRVE